MRRFKSESRSKMPDWQVEPHPLDPTIAASVQRVESLLPHLSDEPTRVLRQSDLYGTSFAELLSDRDKATMLAFAKGVV